MIPAWQPPDADRRGFGSWEHLHAVCQFPRRPTIANIETNYTDAASKRTPGRPSPADTARTGARTARGAATRSAGRTIETHFHGVDRPTPRSDASRRRDSPQFSAIRTASRLKSSVCFIIFQVSLNERLKLKSLAQNRYKSSRRKRIDRLAGTLPSRMPCNITIWSR